MSDDDAVDVAAALVIARSSNAKRGWRGDDGVLQFIRKDPSQ